MPIIIGVSACLLGRPVRFDGGHKRDDFVTETLGEHVTYVSVCPEIEIGLGTPRPTLRLVQAEQDSVRLIMTGGVDHTDTMRRYAERRLDELASADLDGFILKKDSPSCGVQRVKVYAESGVAERRGRGVFAQALTDRWPHLPVEDEGRLCDARIRENFIERVFAFRRLKALFEGRWTVGRLVAFHTAHKCALMAHSLERYRELGRLVADAKTRPRGELRDAYVSGVMTALSVPATPKKHANVLMHMVGHFRGRLDAASRDELLACIDDYRQELLPLVVPVTLVAHHVRRLGVDYLAGQVYLQPHPKELMLRNHV